jgi:hypothetical protein
MIAVAVIFAISIIGASWATKGLWYEDWVDAGIYLALIVWMGFEGACGSCRLWRKRVVASCK